MEKRFDIFTCKGNVDVEREMVLYKKEKQSQNKAVRDMSITDQPFHMQRQVSPPRSLGPHMKVAASGIFRGRPAIL